MSAIRVQVSDVNKGNGKAIAVFGGSRIQPRHHVWREAKETGRLLAEAGFAVATGGYGGMMEAVSRGACEAGGHVIGVTCHIFVKDGLSANGYVTREVPTATMYERLQTLVGLADGYLTLRGSVGTLSELMLVWSLLVTGSLPPRPLVLLGKPYRGLLAALQQHTGLGKRELGWVQVAESPGEAVALLAAGVQGSAEKEG